ALQLHIAEGDEDHQIAQTLAATVPNAELFVDRRRGALLHRRAVDFLQALVGDEFRAARRSHTVETTGRCVVHRRVRDERAASAGGEVSKYVTRPFRFGVVCPFTTDLRAWRDRVRRIADSGYSTLLMPDVPGWQPAP